MPRFKKFGRKNPVRCETETLVSQLVYEAVEAAAEEMKAEHQIQNNNLGYSKEDNSLVEPEPEGGEEEEEEEEKEKNTEQKSDFRIWLEQSRNDFDYKPRKAKTTQEILGDLWLDFVEKKVMQTVLCNSTCGKLDDDTTVMSSAASSARSSDVDSEVGDLAPTHREVTMRRRRSSNKRNQSRK